MADLADPVSLAILTAATQARLPYLVFASVASANQDTGVPHFESKHHIEQRLTASTLGHTVVAPTYFFDNVLGDPSIARGTMPLALPGDRTLQQLDRGDFGRSSPTSSPTRHPTLERGSSSLATTPCPTRWPPR